MDDEGFLECTQALPDDWDGDSDGEPHEQPELVAWLLVGDTKYEVYEGETKIGRDSASCAIVLSQKVLSKEHAALEVTSGVHTLVDLGSMNKTRIGKMALKPHVRYALQGGESIRFGDVLAKYIIKPKAPCEDSGSETGSESMLQLEDPEDRTSPVLTHELPGLDTSNQVSNEPGTSKNSPECTLNESETQEDKKGLSGVEFSPSGFHRTVIPESPSTSQSTHLQGRKASSISETPGSVSAIKDVTPDNDSFFFEPSQPENKTLKEKLCKTTENKGEVDYNSDASTDLDEDIATQLFDDSVDNVTSTAKKSCTVKKDKCDEDLCFQPTQLFTDTDHQTDKDNADDTQDVLDAFDDSIEKPSLSTSRDEDDEYVPTQLFFDDESDCVFKKPATLAPKSKKRISGGQRASKVDEDLFEEYLLAPTQPYGECSKSKQAVSDEDDIYDVPTQLFSTDKVGENNNIKDREDMKESASDRDNNDINNMSSQPTQLFSNGRVSADVIENYGNSSKIADGDSSDNNDNIFNQPTQPFVGDKDKINDFFDAPTQVFEEESLDSKKKKPGGNSLQEGSKTRLEIMKTTVHCSDKVETPKERLGGDEDNVEEEDLLPTQLFDPTKSSKESPKLVDSDDDDDLLATQLFDPCEKSVKIPRSDDEEDEKSRRRNAVFQTPLKGNDVSDEELTPTQIFNHHKSAAKIPKRLVDNDDGLPPTQVFEGHSASKETIESVDDGKFAPTQYFNCSESALKTPKSMLNDSLPPTQLYSTLSAVDNPGKAITSHELPATQLYSDCSVSSDSPKPLLDRTSTKPFATEEKTCKSFVDLDDVGLLPTQPYADSNENLSMNMQSIDKISSLPSTDEIITEAPTQPYINVSSVESSCTQKGPNMVENVELQATEKGHMENIDEDATQDISFDGFIGVDNTHVLEQPLGKTMEKKEIAWDNASDADSDASETLLNNDTLKGEENTTNSKLELTKVQNSTLLAFDENSKKELSNIENYHSDESTDVEDELSTVQNMKENGGQCSAVKLTHDGGILAEDSSHAGKLSVEKKTSSSTAKLSDDIGPNMNIQNISCKQSTTVTSTLQEEVMQNSNETEEMLALDVCLVDSQDETQVKESSVFKNISDLAVKLGRNKETSFPLSSDSDSEEENFNVSQKIFDLTPHEKLNTPSSSSVKEEIGSVAALSQAKRKLACSKEDSGNIHNYSDIEESPNKKRCNRAAKKNENKPEKQRITRSKLNTKKIVGVSVLENETRSPIGDKRLPNRHQQCSNMQITADKPDSGNDEDKTLKVSSRQTRKRTQGSLELLANNSKSDASRCKTPKLEAPEMELDHKSSKSLKSCDLEKNYANQVPPRKLPRLLPVRNVKQEEKFGKRRQDPECATIQSKSATDSCREVTVDDVQEAQQSNTFCGYSTSNNQNNQQLASKSERRNTRRRTVNPVPETQKEESSETQRPENKTDKRTESKREISQEQKEISGVRRSRGRKSRVTHSEVEVQNNKEDCGKGKIHIGSSEKTECASENPTVLQNKVGLIEKVEGCSTKLTSKCKYRGKKSVANASTDVSDVNSSRNVDKVDLELKGEQINKTEARSSLLASKESLERTLTFTKDEMIDEKSDSKYECHANKIATRGPKKCKTTIVSKPETMQMSKSALKEAGTSNEDENRAASENLSKIRTSRRARRGPNRFSPDPDSQRSLGKNEENEMLKGTNSGSQNSEDERSRKEMVGDNENEDSKSSEDFSVPSLRRGRRTKKSQDGIDNNIKIVKENVIEQPRNHSEIRRGRASIATSQPSSVKSYPKTRSRFSVLPGNTGNTRKQEGNTESKVLQIEDKPKLPSAISKRSTNKDDKGETSGHLLESEDSQCFLKRKRKEGMSNIDQGDSGDHSERRGMSTDCSEIDSEDSQGSVKRKGRKATEKLLSTPKCGGKQELSGSNKILWSPSQRQLQASNRPRVLFTGYKDAQDEKIVLDLGGKVVESAQECTVLVTTAIKRTCKLLAVMGKGMPIVSPSWLSASKQARNFIDPWEFLVKDRESEMKFGFRLEQSLRSASKYQLFEGLEIHATKSVKPPPEQMKEIIECSGGQYLDMPPKRYAPQIRIVSCPEDKGLWTTFQRVGIPILGTEFILTGLLRHQLLLDEFVLTPPSM
ncbi:mediator of DNA damage checkpoint protein 1-like isoform X2 [Macrobrachium rosenbergii]|uniref:mediator of DNA damage checkpoint protein 1-like isoform X2 n=1 Tax=Macrobrachium rosenbergii TaxID=79674 RepID=UPI0034D583C8